MRYEGYVACMGKEMRLTFAHEIQSERPLGRPRHRRVENNETYL